MPIGALSHRASFLRRFRIYVRKTIYFEREISALGPQFYGCPSDCVGPKADPKHGCPKCEYTIRRKRFEKETHAEFRKGSPGPEADNKWPLDTLAYNLAVVSRAAVARKSGYNPKWSITFARLVDVYRSEVAKARAVDAYNLSQKDPPAPSRRGSKRLRLVAPEDDDDVE